MNLPAIGNRIKAARENLQLTQFQLAAQTGLLPSQISQVEDGEKLPKLQTFIKIANALGVSADELLQDSLVYQPSKEEPKEQAFPEFVDLLNKLSEVDQYRLYNALRSFVECTAAPLFED